MLHLQMASMAASPDQTPRLKKRIFLPPCQPLLPRFEYSIKAVSFSLTTLDHRRLSIMMADLIVRQRPSIPKAGAHGGGEVVRKPIRGLAVDEGLVGVDAIEELDPSGAAGIEDIRKIEPPSSPSTRSPRSPSSSTPRIKRSVRKASRTLPFSASNRRRTTLFWKLGANRDYEEVPFGVR